MGCVCVKAILWTACCCQKWDTTRVMCVCHIITRDKNRTTQKDLSPHSSCKNGKSCSLCIYDYKDYKNVASILKNDFVFIFFLSAQNFDFYESII
jgi:hypothetical protein